MPFSRTGILLAAGLALVAGPALARCEDFVAQEKPQNTFAQNIGRSFETIEEEGWIEFALYEDFAPWSSLVAGEPQGIDVDIARLIAAELGVEPRFRLVAASETLDADLRNYIWKGAIVDGHVSDVMLHVPYDSAFTCRVEQAVFTGQYGAEALAIGYDRATYPDKGPVPAYFRFDPVGVENDSLSDFYLSSIGNGTMAAGIHRYRDTAAAMAALAAGEVGAVMAPLAQIEAALTPEMAVHQPPLVGLARGQWTVGVAVSQQHRDLGYAVDYAIETALADGRIAAIFAAAGVSHLTPER
ncbi:Bacterial extracellular solute-binding proteins, family 3 [Aquimixticola soesokkakensis]|uniref:Bacterial extracellular solute-binding proteins, family 3 n=1 Tax=Aquimixticola soesokkakensis TaxID=1519096 RepID=A0A1Y5RTS5_9RHOB|nr:transporter substrate-binding domain-containing protein [Aquimixticola soesokkakensis]SLN25308.1 Bacterial extracellular solute-binding proteins, family 3 [Aquimixticola soesokkakensis]